MEQANANASGTNSLDRAFFRLHFRSSTIISSLLGSRARKGIEKVLLLLATFSFLLFTWMHINHVLFVDLSHSLDTSRYIGLFGNLQFHKPGGPNTNDEDLNSNSAPVSGNSASPLHRSKQPSILLPDVASSFSTPSSSSTCLAKLIQQWNDKVCSQTGSTTTGDSSSCVMSSTTLSSASFVLSTDESPSCSSPTDSLSLYKTESYSHENVHDPSSSSDRPYNKLSHSSEYDTRLLRVLIQRENNNATYDTIPAASFLYTLERGLLTLPNRTREKLGIKVETIIVSDSSICLGGTLSRWALKMIGYEAHVLNSLVLGTSGRGGYVLAEHNGEIHALSRASEVNRLSNNILHALLLKAGTLCSALFLVFSSSSLASFILAQTQQRMLRFTVALQQHVNTRRSVLPLVLTHLIDSVVFVPIILGVHFFLFEFFDDQLLAFYVILTVWTCEIWSITTCRTAESLKVFPRVFGLLMTWFHTYYLTYPFGYTFLCLITSVLGLICCAFHLFNRYELPALQSGSISVVQPRSPSVSALLGLSVPSFLLLRRQETIGSVERRHEEVNADAAVDSSIEHGELPDAPTTNLTTSPSTSFLNINAQIEREEESSAISPDLLSESTNGPIPSIPSSMTRMPPLRPIKNSKSDDNTSPSSLSSSNRWTSQDNAVLISSESRNQTRADDRTRLLYGTPGRSRNPAGLTDIPNRRRGEATSEVTDSNSQELSSSRHSRRKRAATESAFFDDWFF